MSRLAPVILACTLLAGCGGEKGAKVTGVIVEDGQPLRVADKERVLLTLVPVSKEADSVKAHPGAEFTREDASFTFVGPGRGLVAPGEYKVCLTVQPRHGTDRFGGAFEHDKTPLTYAVTDEAQQQLVIDVKRKTVARQ